MNMEASTCMEYERVRLAGSSTSARLKKGAWTAQEDRLLKSCIDEYGEGKWHLVPIKAGLNRCRKSCRLRWLNYLKPNIKRGAFGEDEVDLILRMHKLLGNRWSLIAGRIPGRTANDVKNYWNTHLDPHRKRKMKEPKEKKESSHPAATLIIRPQPMNLTKNLNSHSVGNKGSNIVAANNQDENSTKSVINDDVNTSPSGLSLSPILLDNMISEYWDELFDDLPVGTSSSFGGVAPAEGESIDFLDKENGHAALDDFCLNY